MSAPQLVTYAPSTTSVAAPVTVTAGIASSLAPTITTRPAPPAAVVQPAAPGVSAEYVQGLERRLADLETMHAAKTHSAIVFIKPHAVTEEVTRIVKTTMASVGIHVVSEGVIAAEEIDEKGLIDTHYGAIASKAVNLDPVDLAVTPEAEAKFETLFGLSWTEAVQQGVVFNAMQATEALSIPVEELGAMWSGLTKDVDLLKFGGGFYIGKINNIFVVNGFYMDMRVKFTTPGTCIYFFETEWDARALSWKDFRSKVLGCTDPIAAEPGSLRHTIYSNWEAFGLQSCPNTGDNAVHGSASPFEALAERKNWLGAAVEDDFYGRAMMAAGIPVSTIEKWCSDPQVSFEGAQTSLFDALEDLDSRECLARCAHISQETADSA